MRTFLGVILIGVTLACAGGKDEEDDEGGDGQNPCERAGDRIIAVYEDCDIEFGGTDTGGETAECTEELGEMSLCLAACIEATSCEVLTGETSDTGEIMEYADCAVEC